MKYTPLTTIIAAAATAAGICAINHLWSGLVIAALLGGLAVFLLPEEGKAS